MQHSCSIAQVFVYRLSKMHVIDLLTVSQSRVKTINPSFPEVGMSKFSEFLKPKETK